MNPWGCFEQTWLRVKQQGSPHRQGTGIWGGVAHWIKLLNKAVLLELFMNIWSCELFLQTFLQSISQKRPGSLWLAGQLNWLNRKPFIEQVMWDADFRWRAAPKPGKSKCLTQGRFEGGSCQRNFWSLGSCNILMNIPASMWNRLCVSKAMKALS